MRGRKPDSDREAVPDTEKPAIVFDRAETVEAAELKTASTISERSTSTKSCSQCGANVTRGSKLRIGRRQPSSAYGWQKQVASVCVVSMVRRHLSRLHSISARILEGMVTCFRLFLAIVTLV